MQTTAKFPICLAFAAMLSSCSAPSREPQSPRVDQTVDAGKYIVCAPAGEGWKTRIDQGKDTVKFDRVGKAVSGGRTSSSILVFLNGVRKEKGPVTELTEANDYRDYEEDSMLNGALRGEYKVESMERGVTTIGDKKLYTLKYKATKGISSSGRGTVSTEAMLYIYFPPNFTASRRFFSIVITEGYQGSASASVDFTKVEPVISSLKLK